jgi:hypothetical protein
MRDKRQRQIQQDIWAKKSIDGNLFQSDADYRRRQILALMHTTEDRGLEDAMLLASSNGVAKQDMLLAHLEWLFSSNVPNDVLVKRLMGLKELAERFPDESMEALKTIKVDGLDHLKRLSLYRFYLECLDNSDSSNPDLTRQLQTRCQLLQMLTNTALGEDIDFNEVLEANYMEDADSLANALDVLLKNNSDALRALEMAPLAMQLRHLDGFDLMDAQPAIPDGKIGQVCLRHVRNLWATYEEGDGHFAEKCGVFFRQMDAKDVESFLQQVRNGKHRLPLVEEARLANEAREIVGHENGLAMHLENLVALQQIKDPVTKHVVELVPWLRHMDGSFAGDFDNPVSSYLISC